MKKYSVMMVCDIPYGNTIASQISEYGHDLTWGGEYIAIVTPNTLLRYCDFLEDSEEKAAFVAEVKRIVAMHNGAWHSSKLMFGF